jgi:hypothetical protein
MVLTVDTPFLTYNKTNVHSFHLAWIELIITFVFLGITFLKMRISDSGAVGKKYAVI